MVAGLDERKRALRERIGALRREVPGADRERIAEAVAAALLACPELRDAASFGLYAALPDELPTHGVFAALRRLGCRVALPAAGPSQALVFRVVDDWAALVRGRWGVYAPPSDAESVIAADLDVVLLPGVAFDLAGQRLGRGGGHYDATFPPGGRGPLLIGLAWSFQIVDHVPHDSRDRRVDGIVTENGCVLEPRRRR